MIDLPWLPEYKITRHRKARYVKFRMGSSRELKITIPYRYNMKELPGVIEEHRDWILKQLEKLPVYSDELPTKIELKAVNQCWQVVYMKTDARLKLMERPDNQLVLFGDIDDKGKARKLLKRWLQVKARRILPTMLKEVSDAIELPYQKLTVRSQNTLWGSCTSAKSISLNYKLILLPGSLAWHVMIHELCHTVYLNHSVHFWNLVGSFDPDWRKHRRELRKADDFIPAWVNLN